MEEKRERRRCEVVVVEVWLGDNTVLVASSYRCCHCG